MLGSPMLAINKCLLAGNGGLSALLPANILLFISTIHLMMLYLVLHAMHHPPPPSFSREGAIAIHCRCQEIESREERFTLVLTNITPAAIAVRHRRHCRVFPTTNEAWSKELWETPNAIKHFESGLHPSWLGSKRILVPMQECCLEVSEWWWVS